MSQEVTARQSIPAMSDNGVAAVRELEIHILNCPQEPIHTDHVLHGGMYFRSMKLLAGVLMTSVLIKIPTTLIIQGDVSMFVDEDQPLRISGYNVLPASPHRKVAILAHEDTHMTMMFPTPAETVDEAEQWFTDEVVLLMSNKDKDMNSILITGV